MDPQPYHAAFYGHLYYSLNPTAPQSHALPAPAAPIPQDPSAYGSPSGMRPEAAAAVEALSQLIDAVGHAGAATQWHGMDFAAPGPGGLPLVRCDAVSGRGSRRIDLALRYPTANSGGPPSQGRGRGGHSRSGNRGRGRHRSISKSSHTSNPPSASEAETPAVPQPSIPQIFWCDICRVDCNSSEVLEIHKNGKRHKKTVQKLEEIQAREKQLAEYEANYAVGTSVTVLNLPKPLNESQAEAIKQLEMVVKRADEHLALERSELEFQNASVVGVSNMETAQQNQSFCEQAGSEKLKSGTDELPEAPLQKVDDQKIDGQGMTSHNPKRKNKAAGHGSKRLRSSEPMQKKLQVKEQPVICTFCNVTCYSRAVFEIHLVGKKHISRVKQYQAGEAVLGPLGYFPLAHPQVCTSHGVPPLFYGFQTHTMAPQLPQEHPPHVLEKHNPSQHPVEEQVPFAAPTQVELRQEGVIPENQQPVALVANGVSLNSDAELREGSQNVFPGNVVLGSNNQPVCVTPSCQDSANEPLKNEEIHT